MVSSPWRCWMICWRMSIDGELTRIVSPWMFGLALGKCSRMMVVSFLEVSWSSALINFISWRVRMPPTSWIFWRSRIFGETPRAIIFWMRMPKTDSICISVPVVTLISASDRSISTLASLRS